LIQWHWGKGWVHGRHVEGKGVVAAGIVIRHQTLSSNDFSTGGKLVAAVRHPDFQSIAAALHFKEL